MKKIISEIRTLNESKKTINIFAAFCVCALLTFCFCFFMPVNGEMEIYQNFIRLHVIANSDSGQDQNLKLEVRDYILGDIAKLTQECKDTTKAADKIRENLQAIENQTLLFIKQKGYDYPVKVTLSKEMYPERTYTDAGNTDYIFPSGKYRSLRIIIGEGEGKNWWCVLFPPLCLSGSKVEEELAVAGYSNEQVNILKKDKESKYVIKFKILEILSDFFG